jgi:hypothetical protein
VLHDGRVVGKIVAQKVDKLSGFMNSLVVVYILTLYHKIPDHIPEVILILSLLVLTSQINLRKLSFDVFRNTFL